MITFILSLLCLRIIVWEKRRRERVDAVSERKLRMEQGDKMMKGEKRHSWRIFQF